MRRLLAAVAVVLAAVAPPAAANHHRADCGYEAVPTGAGYEVVVYAAIAGAPSDTVSVSCEVYSLNEHVVTAPHRPGTGVSVTSARARWTPGDYGLDYYCVVTVVNGDTDRSCVHVDVTQVPPQAVWDAAGVVTRFVERRLPVEDCGYDSFTQQTLTGGTWTGFAWGYAVRGPDDDVAISCVVKVNGVPVAQVDSGTSRAAAVAAGRVEFTAGDADVVSLCRVVTVNGAATETCPGPYWGPPEDWSEYEEFFGYLDDAFVLADGLYCPVLGAHAGTYGPVTVTGGGDVYHDGALTWDCYPFEPY